MNPKDYNNALFTLKSIIHHHTPAIYNDIDKFILELTKCNLFFYELEYLLKNNASIELYNNVMLNDTHWNDSILKIKSMIVVTPNTQNCIYWLDILALAIRQEIHNLNNISYHPPVIEQPLPVVKVQNQPDNVTFDIDYTQNDNSINSDNYNHDNDTVIYEVSDNTFIYENYQSDNNKTVSELEQELRIAKNNLKTYEDKEFDLKSKLTKSEEELQEIEDLLNSIDDKIISKLTHKKNNELIKNLESMNIELSKDIDILTKKYNKTLDEFNEYDAEYQEYNDIANELKSQFTSK